MLQSRSAKHTEDNEVPKIESKYVRNFVLIGLHISFALFLLLITLFQHGPPILTGDETAALGFFAFFILGLPVLAAAIGTFVVSILAGKWWLNVLAAALIVTFILAMLSFWTGVLASFGYFAFAIWALVQGFATEGARNQGVPDSQTGRRRVKNILLLLVVLLAAGLFAAVFLLGV